jgi:hypothetical protein
MMGRKIKRDKRWENMECIIAPMFLGHEDLDIQFNYLEWTEILLGVTYKNMYYYEVQRIHNDDLNNIHPDVFGWLLNQMVEQMDRRLDLGPQYACYHFEGRKARQVPCPESCLHQDWPAQKFRRSFPFGRLKVKKEFR